MRRTFLSRSFLSNFRGLRYQASPPLSWPPSFCAGDSWSKSKWILQSWGRSNFFHDVISVSAWTASLALAFNLKCQFWLKFTFLSSIIWLTSSLVADFISGCVAFSWVASWPFSFAPFWDAAEMSSAALASWGFSSFFSSWECTTGSAAWLVTGFAVTSSSTGFSSTGFSAANSTAVSSA